MWSRDLGGELGAAGAGVSAARLRVAGVCSGGTALLMLPLPLSPGLGFAASGCAALGPGSRVRYERRRRPIKLLRLQRSDSRRVQVLTGKKILRRLTGEETKGRTGVTKCAEAEGTCKCRDYVL